MDKLTNKKWLISYAIVLLIAIFKPFYLINLYIKYSNPIIFSSIYWLWIIFPLYFIGLKIFISEILKKDFSSTKPIISLSILSIFIMGIYFMSYTNTNKGESFHSLFNIGINMLGLLYTIPGTLISITSLRDKIRFNN